MQTFGDLVRAYLGAEDVDSTIVEYLVNVAADVHDESMTIEEYVDLVSIPNPACVAYGHMRTKVTMVRLITFVASTAQVLQMMPDSRLNSSGRDVAAICFGDLLEEVSCKLRCLSCTPSPVV